MKAKTSLFLTLILLIASSCTIEKQLHSRGFHVEFHKRQRSSDSPDAITGQPATKIAESELITITTDSIIAPILQEKEEIVVSESANEQVIPATKVISGTLKRKITAGTSRIRTGISIQTHFSESLMSNSLKENQKKYSAKKGREIDWEEVSVWLYLVLALTALVFLTASLPGVSIGAALLGVLVGAVIVTLVCLLIASAIGDFEWFWSGR